MTAAQPPQPAPQLVDPFRRAITYLRVSVTDRCDFRCLYCMAEEMTFLPKRDLLSLEELDQLCTTFIDLGVRKLRITGGEPLVRKNILWFFDRMGRHLGTGALDELTLTTNGSQLSRFAPQLAGAGVKRVNVSLDTLDEAKFKRITRWGRLAQVLDGIEAAQKAGLRVKINTVALKGTNDDETHTLVEWCDQMGMDLTFIEVMPMGEMGEENRLDQYYSLDDLRADLGRRWTLTETDYRTGGPARYFRVGETGQRIGFIYAPDPQFLRKLQPGAPHLHRPALHVPGPGRRRRSARGDARGRRRRGPEGRHPRGHQPASPRATISTIRASGSRARSGAI